MAKRKKYSEQFKKDAVRLMRNRGTRTVAEVADELGVGASMLNRWHQTHAPEVSRGAVKAQEEREDVEKLRRRVRELEMENALLKKAASLFAREVK
jgi:transposase